MNVSTTQIYWNKNIEYLYHFYIIRWLLLMSLYIYNRNVSVQLLEPILAFLLCQSRESLIKNGGGNNL